MNPEFIKKLEVQIEKSIYKDIIKDFITVFEDRIAFSFGPGAPQLNLGKIYKVIPGYDTMRGPQVTYSIADEDEALAEFIRCVELELMLPMNFLQYNPKYKEKLESINSR